MCDPEHVDEDCDDTTFGERDQDGDGAIDARCCNRDAKGELRCGTDCHDLQANVYPGADEVCDGFDNDCDGKTDEGLLVLRYRDRDGDGYGGDEQVEVCPDKPGTVDNNDDCDDNDATVHPGMPELCDGRDNDCDGEVERPGEAQDVVWYLDADNDGFGVTDAPIAISCAPPPFPVLCLDWLSSEFCAPGDPRKFMPPTAEAKIGHHHQEGSLTYAIVAGDCDDLDPEVYPGAEERCNGHDDDCDGRADYRIGTNDFEDDDGDGLVDAACERRTRDCDDMNAVVGPRREEICDGLDNDCDGMVDEGATSTAFYPDDDGDGYGDGRRTPVHGCSAVPGYVANGDDCDDGDPEVHPDQRESCDLRDQDCDGRIDESIPGCGAPSRVTGIVSRTDDATALVEGARVSAYDIHGALLDMEPTRPSGRFDLDVPEGPVVVAVEPPEGSDLIGVARALIAPARDLRVRLDPAARWDALADAAGYTRDADHGLFVAEFDGVTPEGGQGVLLAPGGGTPVARAGEVAVDGAVLPSYEPPAMAPTGEAFASVTYFNIAAGLHNPMLTEVIACQPYAVSELHTGYAPPSRMLHVVSYPVLPNTVTLMRVDCSASLDTCCAGWGGRGCKDDAVEACVCAQRPSCCEDAWDSECAELVTAGGCSTCSSIVPHAGSCCMPGDQVGCAHSAVEACVCEMLPACCVGPWEPTCAGGLVSLRCGYCPGGGLSAVPFGMMGLDGAGN